MPMRVDILELLGYNALHMFISISFPSVYINLHFHQQFMRVLFAPHPYHYVFAVKKLAILVGV